MAAILFIISLLTYPSGQELKSVQPMTDEVTQEDSESASSGCLQPAAEQDALMREAEANQYTVRQVQFLGNNYTRDRVLRQRMWSINEGEIFTGEKLVRSLESVSRLRKIIHPVKLKDVIINLNKPDKMVDMLICFKERRKLPRRSGSNSGAHGRRTFVLGNT
jgi:outer membrane protein assembly factor BamA